MLGIDTLDDLSEDEVLDIASAQAAELPDDLRVDERRVLGLVRLLCGGDPRPDARTTSTCR